MFTSTARRTSLALAVALGIGGATAAALPTASLARPVGGDAPAKDCKLTGGNPIRSGSTGRAGGIEYSCSDGVACQIEGGRVTRKCSHASRLTVLTGLGSARVQTFARTR
jgi:hypothetical protein